jgi:hypothetical protein
MENEKDLIQHFNKYVELVSYLLANYEILFCEFISKYTEGNELITAKSSCKKHYINLLCDSTCEVCKYINEIDNINLFDLYYNSVLYFFLSNKFADFNNSRIETIDKFVIARHLDKRIKLPTSILKKFAHSLLIENEIIESYVKYTIKYILLGMNLIYGIKNDYNPSLIEHIRHKKYIAEHKMNHKYSALSLTLNELPEIEYIKTKKPKEEEDAPKEMNIYETYKIINSMGKRTNAHSRAHIHSAHTQEYAHSHAQEYAHSHAQEYAHQMAREAEEMANKYSQDRHDLYYGKAHPA